MLVKIVKISNLLVLGDYVGIGRKGMEIGVLVKIVSYLQGYVYKDVVYYGGTVVDGGKEGKIVDVVRDTIQELTNVSLYLIAISVDQNNIQEFIDYYDSDF